MVMVTVTITVTTVVTSDLGESQDGYWCWVTGARDMPHAVHA